MADVENGERQDIDYNGAVCYFCFFDIDDDDKIIAKEDAMEQYRASVEDASYYDMAGNNQP